MKSYIPKLLSAGLCIVLASLFFAIYTLNSRQYTSRIANAESSVEKQLEQQVQIALKYIEQEEKQQFALLKNDQALKVDLFWIRRQSVVPANLPGPGATISEQDADKAFRQGIELLPQPEALSFFETAARGPYRTRDGLYQKLSALFNVLELNPTPQTVYSILKLLDHGDRMLLPSQSLFFHSMLRDQVTDLETLKDRFHELIEVAEEINRKIIRQQGPYRVSFQDKVLTVRADGLALLYTPKVTVSNPVNLSGKPAGVHRKIIPGVYAVIPEKEIHEQKIHIRNQYRVGNLIFCLMALLGMALTAGIIATVNRMRRLNAMRTRFIATVSHELRSPLSLIRLHAETLAHGRAPKDREEEYRRTILAESERLTGIVNNVLDFSRMERGKLQVHLEQTNLSTLTESVVKSFHDRAQQEGIKLQQNIAPDIVVKVDSIAYSQIVFNLLDNAIKYSDDAESVQIKLNVSNGCIMLAIADQGIGIPDSLKKRIFEDFTRSDDRRVTARRGSGIGLSVARRLAEKMNGTIEVTDNAPKGSIFTMHLKEWNETAGG